MEAGDWVAAAAAVVAVCAMAVAIWQAREARGARRATEFQALEAMKARKIAEDALAITRQVEADRVIDRRAEQHRRDAPDFAYEWAMFMGTDEILVDVRMTHGPDLDYVEFTAKGPNVRGVSSPNDNITGAPALRWDGVSETEATQVRIDTADPNAPVHALLELRCVERGSGREWTKRYAIYDPV